MVRRKADNSPWLDALVGGTARAAREGIDSSDVQRATNGSWHATQVVFNNASSAIDTDGATASGPRLTGFRSAHIETL
jgi:hypothetical protein